MPILVKVPSPGKLDTLDFLEISQRRVELEALLSECPDMPADSPLRQEYAALCAALDGYAALDGTVFYE